MIYIFGDSFAAPCKSDSSYLWYKNLSNEPQLNYGKPATGPIYTMGKVYWCLERNYFKKGDSLVVLLSNPKREEHYDGMHSRICLTNYLYFLKTLSEKISLKTIAFICFDEKRHDNSLVENLDSEWFRFYPRPLSYFSVNEIGGSIPDKDTRSNHFQEKNHYVLSGIVKNHLHGENNSEVWDLKTSNTNFSEFIYDN